MGRGTLSAIREIELASRVKELRSTVDFALGRCLNVAEIIDRMDCADEDLDTADVDRLSELKLSLEDRKSLFLCVQRLAQRGEALPAKLRSKFDRTILRVLRLLPARLSQPFVEQHLQHRLKERRKWAYSTLRQIRLTASLARRLSEVYRERGDQEALQLIARNPKQVKTVGATFLLENLDEEYWRARVVEGVLACDRALGISLSEIYPFEFAHAVGRLEDTGLLSPLRELFSANSGDLEFISIYAYALGKLKARRDLHELQTFLDNQYGQVWP